MALKQIESGWIVDMQPGGRGAKRFRKTFSSKGEVLAYEAYFVSFLNLNEPNINIKSPTAPANNPNNKLSIRSACF